MKRGILYICFGKEFDQSLALLTGVSRKFTDLPITVLSNIKENSPLWKKYDNINFIYFDKQQASNRQFKTQALFHSPYDETLLLDADTVIQKKGVEDIFSLLKDADILANPEFDISSGQHAFNIYVKTIIRTETERPVTVYSGGFLLFKKNDRVNTLFNLWNQYWLLMGSGREMPALACAIKNSKVHVRKEKGLYSCEKEDENSIIQHNGDWGKRFFFFKRKRNIFTKFGSIDPISNKSFDKNRNKDWKLVPCP